MLHRIIRTYISPSVPVALGMRSNSIPLNIISVRQLILDEVEIFPGYTLPTPRFAISKEDYSNANAVWTRNSSLMKVFSLG